MKKQSVQKSKILKSKRSTKMILHSEGPEQQIFRSYEHFSTLKRSQSQKNLRKQEVNDLFLIQSKYQQLQHNFKKILEQTQKTTKLFKKQKVEIEKFKEQSLKDKKEIQRLRMMLGFVKKEDFGVQVESNYGEKIYFEKVEIQTSTASKTSISTESEKWLAINRMKAKSRKIKHQWSIQKSAHERLLNSKSVKNFNFHNDEKVKTARQKYQFVPTLVLY